MNVKVNPILTIGVHSSDSESESSEDLNQEDLEKLKNRDQIRKEKAKEREKEYRVSHTSKDSRTKTISSKKYNFVKHSADRDISEKVALGIARPTAKEGMYDQRLFNQSSGLSSGFQGNDSYSIYDKPLFNGSSANTIYRPKKSESSTIGGIQSEKINDLLTKGPHNGFQGADGDVARDGPVKFEKEQDVFGMDEFMSTVKRGRTDDNHESRKKR
jgi:SNW domain-containing protein 1